MAIAKNPIPSVSCGIPSVNRKIPVFMSVPTVPNKIPKSVIPTALMIEPEASTIAPIRPRIISEKYSAAPNFNAKAVKGRAKAANIKVPMVPAKKELNADAIKAGPARPLRAIW